MRVNMEKWKSGVLGMRGMSAQDLDSLSHLIYPLFQRSNIPLIYGGSYAGCTCEYSG